MKVNSHNEWDPLQEVIIGTASNARYPKNDLSIAINTASESQHSIPNTAVTMPNVPQSVITETNEDLDIFAKELQKRGIRVRRPDPIETKKEIKTPYWKTTQYFNYCPRDTLFVVGDTIIESPNTFRSRYFETLSYRDILVDYLNSGSRWISAPKPRLRDVDYIADPNSTTTLTNNDPIFDAANILRAGKDIFYLVSNSGNELGLRWPQSTLGSDYRVHPIRSMYSGTHIDTTLALLRPGLALANPARVNSSNLPDILKKWQIIYAPQMEEYQYSNMSPLSSEWLGMNLFMIRPDLAVVDAHQVALIKLLKKHNIDVLPLKLRHGRQLEGGFHCVTLDVFRQGKREDYFTSEIQIHLPTPAAPHTDELHGKRVAKIVTSLAFQKNKDPSKQLLRTLAKRLAKVDQAYQIQGIDFSRAQLGALIHARNNGLPIEFEALGPYLIDYTHHNGYIMPAWLTPEDAIGLKVMSVLQRSFPLGRPVSLYDEYNTQRENTDKTIESSFTRQSIHNFHTSIMSILQQAQGKLATDQNSPILIPESTKIADAEALVKQLDAHGLIVRNNAEILFVNDACENPLYRKICLQTKQGRWLCEALDAAAFLNPRNQKIVHLVVLPDYLKPQQDKVWEILRALNIQPNNYHNIFYSPNIQPHTAAKIIEEAFNTHSSLVRSS